MFSRVCQYQLREIMNSALFGVIDWRDRFVGLDTEVPLLNGGLARYINLDNAASTPPLRHVLIE